MALIKKMAWQNTFTVVFGPGLFAGITAGDWFRLLCENRFAIHPRYGLRFLSITMGSLANSLYRRIEDGRYGHSVAEQTIQPPLFVLGHWRSGTTYLHHLLSQDDRFAFPNFYQVIYPHTFLTTEAISSRLLAPFVPRTRFGLDNVEIDCNVAYEDEFAIAIMSFLSPYMTPVLPRNQQYFDRFLTLEDASPAQLDQWKSALTTFLKKLTWKYRRPLIVKSPPHTCRIKLLLELFPDAKFVHIRRNPFNVFQSTVKAMELTTRYWSLQDRDSVDWDMRIVRQYREMYNAYFEQRSLIPDGHLHEMSYEHLVNDPVEELRKTYDALGLSDFSYFEPRLDEYVHSRRGYRKNEFPEMSNDMQEWLAREWHVCFEKWGYPQRSD